MRRLACAVPFLAFAISAWAADPRPAKDIALAVDQALRTSGYRVRASVSREGEAPEAAVRLTLLGERGERSQRLLLRAVAPDAVRGQAMLLEAKEGKAAGATVGVEPATVDPLAPAFGSDLVPWDFLALWWRWPQQTRVRTERLLDYDCVVIDSAGARGAVSRVRSWVASDLRIPLKLEFYSADGRLLRAMSVLRIARRSNGETAARIAALSLPGRPDSRFELYGGEEGLALAPEEFRLSNGNR